MVCIAAGMPCSSSPVAQPERKHFILVFEKFDLLKELRFGRDSSSWWHTCYSECEMMNEEDVANVPIYAAILNALKELIDGQGGIDRAQALC